MLRHALQQIECNIILDSETILCTPVTGTSRNAPIRNDNSLLHLGAGEVFPAYQLARTEKGMILKFYVTKI